MDNPGQHLIHITSRGPAVYNTNGQGAFGQFKVSAKQPLKDINKFGLLHYNVPRMCDHVVDETFDLVITYMGPTENVVRVPVTMPSLDYHNILVTQRYDQTDQVGQAHMREHGLLCLDELMQSTLNWAIQKSYARALGGNSVTLPEALLGRIGVICKVTTEGLLEFYLGYRGRGGAVVNPGAADQRYTRGVGGAATANTGNPYAQYIQVTTGGIEINAQNLTMTVNGVPVVGPRPTVSNPATTGGAGLNAARATALRITGMGFEKLSQRMKMILGISEDGVSGEVDYGGVGAGAVAAIRQVRGRIQLCTYTHANHANAASGVAHYVCDLPPNLDAPSVMYLQLLVPGTRSKVLGQEDERGGWAIPTPSGQFVSNFVNNPYAQYYDSGMARHMPIVTNQATFNTHFANRPKGGGPIVPNDPDQDEGIGYDFDPIPVNSGQAAVGAAAALIDDNYKIVGAGAIAKSGLVHFGRLDDQGNPIEGARRNPRATEGRQGLTDQEAGFKTGLYRQGPVFTASLVEPNWVYTSTENATMQTFDVQLMWGDTSETVKSVAPHPLQFSIVASP